VLTLTTQFGNMPAIGLRFKYQTIMRKKSHFLKAAFYMFAFLLLQISVSAQSSIKGKVTDAANGNPIIGASITVGKTKLSVVSDAQGAFSILANVGDQLTISSIGYTASSVLASNSILNIKLKPSSSELDEVVVTALGIKREKKKLGYASQEIKGES
jgi:hypothetical protein